MKGYFPHDEDYSPFVIPTSLTSFEVVTVWQEAPPNYGFIIRIFSFVFSDDKPSFEEACSMTMPGEMINFVLPIPPAPTRYALGVLCTKQGGIAGRGHFDCFAVKLSFPSQSQDSMSGNKYQISLVKMNLGDAIGGLKAKLEPPYFDPYSGKIILSASDYLGHKTDVVIDYLSKVSKAL